MVAASDRVAVAFHLSGGQWHDAPRGRLLPEDERLEKLPKQKKIYLAMDKGCEDDLTRKTVKDKGFIPCVSPGSNRRKPWRYNRKLNGFSVGLRASEEYVQGTKNSMLCIWHS
jgi:hypothetical protein